MRMIFSPSSGPFRPLLSVARQNATGAKSRPNVVAWLGPQSPVLRRQYRPGMPPAVLAYMAALMALGLTAILLHPAESEIANRSDAAPAKFTQSLPSASHLPQAAPAPQKAVAGAAPKPSEPAAKEAFKEASLGWLLVPEPMIPPKWPFAGGPEPINANPESTDATAAIPQKPASGDQVRRPEAEPAAIMTNPDEPVGAASEASKARQAEERPVRSIRHHQAERVVADRTERTSIPRANLPAPPPPPSQAEENLWRTIR